MEFAVFFRKERPCKPRVEGLHTVGNELESGRHFLYPRRGVVEEGRMETDISKRVRPGWIHWKKCSEVLSVRTNPTD